MTSEQKQAVCIIEDDVAVRESLALLLESAGCVVTCYSSAEAFLESKYLAQWNCLIVDVRLPGMSGVELLKKLAADGLATPAIVTSGHGDVDSVTELSQFDKVCFLTKPCNPHKLLSIVATSLRPHSSQPT